MSDLHSILIVAVCALVTMGLRFLPFVIFRGDRPTPPYIVYLGKVLPYAIMGMLVVFCLKGVSFTATPYGIPEFLGCAVTALLHIWKRNTLVSIVGGTAVYMVLVQMVF